jgi:hypothetical protein
MTSVQYQANVIMVSGLHVINVHNFPQSGKNKSETVTDCAEPEPHT